jgi:hypothetical protein
VRENCLACKLQTCSRKKPNADECRAELVGAYLMDDAELLGLFGYTATSEITAADCAYAQKLFETLLTFAK